MEHVAFKPSGSPAPAFVTVFTKDRTASLSLKADVHPEAPWNDWLTVHVTGPHGKPERSLVVIPCPSAPAAPAHAVSLCPEAGLQPPIAPATVISGGKPRHLTEAISVVFRRQVRARLTRRPSRARGCTARGAQKGTHRPPGRLRIAAGRQHRGGADYARLVSDYELTRKYDTLNLYRRGAAAKLELNRPERMNAWNTQFGLDLLAAVKSVGEDSGVRAVLITGAGRAFSSGADLKEGLGQTPAGHPDVYTVLTERYHPIIVGIRRMPKPVVAAVNGAAAGVGLSLALACDLVIAAESAYFLLAFVNIGLVPDGGSSLLVPSRVGFARAAEMAMLGERIGARQALEWGLINQAWPDDEFAARADGLAARLAEGPTGSYAGTKRQLNNWLYQQMDQQLEFEARIQQEMAASVDFAEGVTAFAEKRQPRFTGR